MPLKPSAEDDLIARTFASWAGEGAHGLKDDAAQLKPKSGWDLVLTADALIAGVHFRPEDPAAAIGHKALAVNLSDLAAKGADPVAFLLTIALPADLAAGWLSEFAGGLRACAEAAGCRLLGGDTTRTSGPVAVSITAIGQVPQDRMVTRLNARPGDIVAVSGTIGDAALGLLVLQDGQSAAALGREHRDALVECYLRPQPHLALAPAIRDHASAAMDVSDGLVGDLAKLLRASGVAGELDLGAVPLSDAAGALLALDPARLATAVTGGDDYEVLATVPADRFDALRLAAGAAGVTMTAIGRVTAGEGLVCRDGEGREVAFERASFSHF